MSSHLVRTVGGFLLAVGAGTLGLSALVAGVSLAGVADGSGRPLQQSLPNLPQIAVWAVITFIAAILIGLPVTALMRGFRRTGILFRIYTGLVAAIPLSVLWTALLFVAESDRPPLIILFSYAAALSVATALPAYIAYWYAAERSNHAMERTADRCTLDF